MKRYSMQYDSDRRCGWTEDKDGNYVPCFSHQYGMANTVKTCKQYISKCRKAEAEHHPRNFRIYDHWSDIDPETDYVKCVYQED